MADRLSVWFRDPFFTETASSNFFQLKHENGWRAFRRAETEESADLVVFAASDVPDDDFPVEHQKAVHPTWVEHCLIEGQPLPVTRRYDATVLRQDLYSKIAPPKSASPAPSRSSMEIDAPSPAPRKPAEAHKPREAAKKSGRGPKGDAIRISLVDSDSEVPVDANASTLEEIDGILNGDEDYDTSTPKKTNGGKGKRAKKSASVADDTEDDAVHTPPRTRRIKKRGRKKRIPTEEEEEEEEDQAPMRKRLRSASLSLNSSPTSPPGRISVAEAKFCLSPPKLKLPKKPPTKRPGQPLGGRPKNPQPVKPTSNVRVYLSNASAEDKKYWMDPQQSRISPTLVWFSSDVDLATHVVAFVGSDSTEPEVLSKKDKRSKKVGSFTTPPKLLAAVAAGKWILRPKWLKWIQKRQRLPSNTEDFESVKLVPGCRPSREAHERRRAYLEEKGMDESEVGRYIYVGGKLQPVEIDPDLPRLLFDEWTFNVDYVSKYDAGLAKLLQNALLDCGGDVSTTANADVWLACEGSAPIIDDRYSTASEPPLADQQLLLEHPEWKKRRFLSPKTKAAMPVWAVTARYLYDALFSWQVPDIQEYPNLYETVDALPRPPRKQRTYIPRSKSLSNLKPGRPGKRKHKVAENGNEHAEGEEAPLEENGETQEAEEQEENEAAENGVDEDADAGEVAEEGEYVEYDEGDEEKAEGEEEQAVEEAQEVDAQLDAEEYDEETQLDGEHVAEEVDEYEAQGEQEAEENQDVAEGAQEEDAQDLQSAQTMEEEAQEEEAPEETPQEETEAQETNENFADPEDETTNAEEYPAAVSEWNGHVEEVEEEAPQGEAHEVHIEEPQQVTSNKAHAPVRSRSTESVDANAFPPHLFPPDLPAEEPI